MLFKKLPIHITINIYVIKIFEITDTENIFWFENLIDIKTGKK